MKYQSENPLSVSQWCKISFIKQIYGQIFALSGWSFCTKLVLKCKYATCLDVNYFALPTASLHASCTRRCFHKGLQNSHSSLPRFRLENLYEALMFGFHMRVMLQWVTLPLFFNYWFVVTDRPPNARNGLSIYQSTLTLLPLSLGHTNNPNTMFCYLRVYVYIQFQQGLWKPSSS